jgi:hypothetical protein
VFAQIRRSIAMVNTFLRISQQKYFCELAQLDPPTIGRPDGNAA